MASKKYLKGRDTIEVGQWACIERLFLHGGVGRPVLITSAGPAHVKWSKPRPEEEADYGRSSLNSVVYLSDTEAEATAIWQMDKRRRELLDLALKKVQQESDELFNQELNAFLKNSEQVD